MRIIIPGGSGLIGHALIPALEQDGHEVLILTRHPETMRPSGSARFMAWDGRTAQGWNRILAGAGAIINLAGESIGSSPR
jgi:NAD dependent epimerase/dehydratase family enzyme